MLIVPFSTGARHNNHTVCNIAYASDLPIKEKLEVKSWVLPALENHIAEMTACFACVCLWLTDCRPKRLARPICFGMRGKL